MDAVPRRNDPVFAMHHGGSRLMPEQVTRELLEKIDGEFNAARTPEEVRAVFKRYYGDVGWKRLCRLFVLQYGVDELWLAEEERGKKAGARAEAG